MCVQVVSAFSLVGVAAAGGRGALFSALRRLFYATRRLGAAQRPEREEAEHEDGDEAVHAAAAKATLRSSETIKAVLQSAVRICLVLALLPSLSSFTCRYIPSFASVRAPWPLRPPSRPPAQRPNPRPSALLLTPSCWQLRNYRPKSCHNEIRAAHGHWISTRGAVLRVVRRAFIGLSIA